MDAPFPMLKSRLVERESLEVAPPSAAKNPSAPSSPLLPLFCVKVSLQILLSLRFFPTQTLQLSVLATAVIYITLA